MFFLLLNISVMSFSKFTSMIDQKHGFLQLCTFLHPWTMCTRNLSPGSCFWSWKTTIIIRVFLFCFVFVFMPNSIKWKMFWSVLISVNTMLMLVGEKILPTLCLLEITWNNKGYPVKLVYKCMYVRVITRMINSLPMTWLVQWRNSITMVYVYAEYQKNCCLLGRYFGQSACNSKVFRPNNIVCNFISWWQLKFYS